jgi:hypothetical protein
MSSILNYILHPVIILLMQSSIIDTQFIEYFGNIQSASLYETIKNTIISKYSLKDEKKIDRYIYEKLLLIISSFVNHKNFQYDEQNKKAMNTLIECLKIYSANSKGNVLNQLMDLYFMLPNKAYEFKLDALILTLNEFILCDSTDFAFKNFEDRLREIIEDYIGINPQNNDLIKIFTLLGQILQKYQSFVFLSK